MLCSTRGKDLWYLKLILSNSISPLEGQPAGGLVSVSLGASGSRLQYSKMRSTDVIWQIRNNNTTVTKDNILQNRWWHRERNTPPSRQLRETIDEISIYLNSAQDDRPQHEALGNDYRVCGVHCPEHCNCYIVGGQAPNVNPLAGSILRSWSWS